MGLACGRRGDLGPLTRLFAAINFALMKWSFIAITAALAAPLAAQTSFSADVDKAVSEILTKTGAPSASIAVVRDGSIAYVHAYGSARLNPPMPATPQMRYSIGSISKQFTATAILMLQE